MATKEYCPLLCSDKLQGTVLHHSCHCRWHRVPHPEAKQPVAQQATFSTYKNRNTMKVVFRCSPSGLVSFISPAYGESVG